MTTVFHQLCVSGNSSAGDKSLQSDIDTSTEVSVPGENLPPRVARLRPTDLFVSVILPILFFAAILGLHARAFDAPWYYDSASRLQEKSYLFQDGLQAVLAIFPQRPSAMLTFYLNYLCAGMSSSSFRLFNAAALAFTALLAALVIVTLLRLVHGENGAHWEKWMVAGLLGMFFAVHPVQVYMVDYIWQRTALLACVFYLLSLLFYLAARTGRIRNRFTGYSACVVAFLLSLTCKENAVTLPAVVILAEIAFFSHWNINLWKRGALWLGLAVITAGILSLLESPHGLGRTSGILNTVSEYYAGSGLSVPEVAFTQCRMLFSYLLLIVAPTPDRVRLISPQLISNSLVDPPSTLPAILGLGLFLCLSLYLLERRPVSGFGFLFFLVNLLPESFLVPQYLFVPYRAVLPMVGILIVAGDLLSSLPAKSATPKVRIAVCGTIAAAFVPALLLVASTTVTKAEHWRNPIEFWKEELKGLPLDSKNLERNGTAQILAGLALALEREKRYDEAIPLLEDASRVTPGDPRNLVLLADAHSGKKEFESAWAYLQRALRMDPDSPDIHWSLGNVEMAREAPAAALPHYRTAVSKGKGDPDFDDSLGTCLLSLGNYVESIEAFTRALSRDPSRVETRYRMSKALLKAERRSEAVTQLLKVIELKPSHWRAHNDMGVILARAGRPDEAAVHFTAALKIDPGNESISRNLETALSSMKKKPQVDGVDSAPTGR